MLIPCKEIASVMQQCMAEEVSGLKKQGKKLRLTTLLIGSASEQLSFVAIKEKKARAIGIEFKLTHLKQEPMYEKFVHILQKEALSPETTGIIVQLPLPAMLMSESLYNFIPLKKEIEGHREKTSFLPPLGLSVLTALKYTCLQSMKYEDLIVTPQDKELFSQRLRGKRVVLLGRGLTGGHPIGKTLSHFKIPFINLASKTDPTTVTEFLSEADVVITAVGKKVITSEMLKPGAILLNVGLRQEKGKLKGDYDEKDVAEQAAWHSATPGGIGPIDVLYLFRNLIDAAKLQ
jgi:methylenetetrahydrofolate dehydrogenase (NADP+)/methenyltetrahydrofolate cyclohydrolase